MLMEHSDRFPDDSVLLGEVQTRIVNDGFEDRIVPIVERSETELQHRQEQAEEHKAYRAQLYKQYPIAERLKDLGAL